VAHCGRTSPSSTDADGSTGFGVEAGEVGAWLEEHAKTKGAPDETRTVTSHDRELLRMGEPRWEESEEFFEPRGGEA
jgi:hypothetical protein